MRSPYYLSNDGKRFAKDRSLLEQASVSRICLILLSHPEGMSIKNLVDEIYEYGKEHYGIKTKPDAKSSLYQEVYQGCAYLKKTRLIDRTEISNGKRQVIVNIRLKNFICEIFKPKSGRRFLVTLNKPLVSKRHYSISDLSQPHSLWQDFPYFNGALYDVWNIKIQNTKKVIEGSNYKIKRTSDYINAIKRNGTESERTAVLPEKEKEIQEDTEELKQKESDLSCLQEDLVKVKNFGNVSNSGLNDVEIEFLLEKLDKEHLQKRIDALKLGGMLNYIGEDSNIIKIFVTELKSSMKKSPYFPYEEILGFKDIDTKPITDTVLSAIKIRAGWNEEDKSFLETHHFLAKERPQKACTLGCEECNMKMLRKKQRRSATRSGL